MNNFEFTPTEKKASLIYTIVMIAYNVVLFSIVGFSDHSVSFWISYTFMMVAFLSVAIVSFFIKDNTPQTKDWVFGFPPLKHTIIYIIVELVLSILFMALDGVDCPWFISLSVQIIVFAFFVVMVVSCFIAQDTITTIQRNVKDSTTFLNLLRIDVEMICEKAPDEETKKAFTALSEKIRYSDPMSNPNLFELEKQLSYYVNEAANSLSANDKQTALHYCELATTSLIERNKKCKALK